MMAASEKKDHALDLVRLILSLANQQQPVPPALRDHLMVVIDQARRLAADPSSVEGSASPEALALERQIKYHNDLASDFTQSTSFDSIDTQLASRGLHSLEGRDTAPY